MFCFAGYYSASNSAGEVQPEFRRTESTSLRSRMTLYGWVSVCRRVGHVYSPIEHGLILTMRPMPSSSACLTRSTMRPASPHKEAYCPSPSFHKSGDPGWVAVGPECYPFWVLPVGPTGGVCEGHLLRPYPKQGASVSIAPTCCSVFVTGPRPMFARLYEIWRHHRALPCH